MDVNNLNLQSRIEIVLTKAAALLPYEMGQQLLAMISPQTLATMAAIVVVWAGAHFLELVK